MPVAAKLVSKDASVSLEWINGESEAQAREEGQLLPSGALNIGTQALTVESVETWEDSTLRRLLDARREVEFRDVRLEKLLRLRVLLREREAAANPAKAAEYQQAQQDYDSFQQDSAIREEEDARTKWELSEDEQQELKRLFRKASKKCHPDVVPPEHQAAASAMFRDLSEAYEKGDLVRVQQIAAQAEAGIFTSSDEATAVDQKASLQARVQAVRAALEKARAELTAVQQSDACRVMSQHPDWDAYFQTQAAKLDQEIERLAGAVEDSKP